MAEEYRLVPDTLYLTVNYIDRYLSGNMMNRQRLQLLGVASMMIASYVTQHTMQFVLFVINRYLAYCRNNRYSFYLHFCRKYEEICAAQVEEFCYITDNTYLKYEVEIYAIMFLSTKLVVIPLTSIID